MKRQLISTKHSNYILECQVLRSFYVLLSDRFQKRGEEGGLSILRITG